MKKYSLAVDFDGVIHQYVTKWIDAETIPDPPMPGAFEWLAEMVKHFAVIIFSARLTPHYEDKELPSGDEMEAALIAMMLWFREHGLPEEVLDQLEFWQEFGKPTALIYLDDRAVRFKGYFPTKSEIHQQLRPWKYDAEHDNRSGWVPAKGRMSYCAEEMLRAKIPTIMVIHQAKKDWVDTYDTVPRKLQIGPLMWQRLLGEIEVWTDKGTAEAVKADMKYVGMDVEVLELLMGFALGVGE